MSYTIRVSLPGYDARTATSPDHYALYVGTETDWVLIKERQRGSVEISAYGSEAIYHNLGYIPTVFAYAQVGSKYVWVYGETMYSSYSMEVYTDRVVFENMTSSTSIFKYYIFYDNA